MSKYSSVQKSQGFIGGAKGRFFFIAATALAACPKFKAIKDTDADFSTLEGAFVLADPTVGFEFFDIMTESGELKWEGVGTKGNKKSKLNKMFKVAGLPDALYKFTEMMNAGEDIVAVLSLADCDFENKIMFGGCCYPANIEEYSGTTGTKGEDDISTMYTLTTYSKSLPPKLPADIEIPLTPTESGS
jgi:hypothetical protein